MPEYEYKKWHQLCIEDEDFGFHHVFFGLIKLRRCHSHGLPENTPDYDSPEDNPFRGMYTMDKKHLPGKK